MHRFIIFGLATGIAATLLYFLFSVWSKKSPQLGHAIELILAGVGVSGGVKLCTYVLNGQVAKRFGRVL